MTRPTVLLVSPLTGSVSGQEAVTRMVLDSPLAMAWELAHVDAVTSRRNADRGVPTWGSLYRFTRLLWTVRTAVRDFRPRAVWLCLGSNRAGLVKFSLLSQMIPQGTAIIAKYGGSDFGRFYASRSSVTQDGIRSVLRRCHVLVEARCLMAQFYGVVLAERIHWAYLGVDPDAIPFTPRKRSARNVLFIGHVSRAKGAADLLAAMPTVTKAIPGARLVMLGEHLRHERNVLHVHDRNAGWRAVKERPGMVEAPGVVVGPALRHALSEADTFCLPSASEGFPVSVLEAMSSGLPLVVTSVGALPEVLTEGTHCRFVPFGNPARLAEVLSDLMSHAGRYARQRMAVENRRAVEERFNLETFADGVRKAVGDVVQG